MYHGELDIIYYGQQHKKSRAQNECMALNPPPLCCADTPNPIPREQLANVVASKIGVGQNTGGSPDATNCNKSLIFSLYTSTKATWI